MMLLDIIRKAIADSGADGLVNTSQECGCLTDDLAPCDNFRFDCQLAKRQVDPIKRGDFDFIMEPLATADREAGK